MQGGSGNVWAAGTACSSRSSGSRRDVEVPTIPVGTSISHTALRLEVAKRGEESWRFIFSAKKPLEVGPVYAVIAHFPQATGDVWLTVGHGACDVDVARFRLHDLDLTDHHQRGTVTFEVQCAKRNAVLRGYVHFEPTAP